MPRPSVIDSMTIAQLEKLLATRHDRLKEAMRQRDRVQKELDKLDDAIARLNGRAGASGNGRSHRPRNEMSLVATLEAVLAPGKPMSVGDIVEAVQKRGYQSNSANFRSLVNMTLVREKQFASAGRGVYQLKK